MKINIFLIIGLVLHFSFISLASSDSAGTESAKTESAKNESEKTKSDSADALTNVKDTESTRVPVPTGKYITGGIVGSIAGFGIGHAIQSRYSDKGYIFTAAEVAGFALILSGRSSDCKKSSSSWSWDDDDFNSHSGDEYECKYTTDQRNRILLGFSIYLGFHIWEIVNLWAGAVPVNEEPKVVSAMLLPYDKDGAQLTISYRF